MKAYELFTRYASKIPFGAVGKTRLSVRHGDGFYVTTAQIVSQLKEEDVEFCTLQSGRFPLLSQIYRAYPKINSVIIFDSANCIAAAKTFVVMRPVLDDTAQIVGTVFFADNLNSTVKSLKRNNCAYYKPEGMVCVGETFFEAWTAATVAEKSALVAYESEKLGGGKKIKPFEAALMRFVYKKKYSAKERVRKLAETEVE